MLKWKDRAALQNTAQQREQQRSATSGFLA